MLVYFTLHFKCNVLVFYLKTCHGFYVKYDTWLYYISNNSQKDQIISREERNTPIQWSYASIVFIVILNDERVLGDLKTFDSGI